MANESKESVYDREIAPLMTKIIETCERAGIAIVASFELDPQGENEDDTVFCTTIIVPETACARLKQAATLLRPKPMYAAMAIVRGGSSRGTA